MADLIACLSTGKGTWSEVTKLINLENWDNIFLITNSFGKENYTNHKVKFILINNDESIKSISKSIYDSLQGKIGFNDIAVNFISGTGKEHMALITALIKLGVGIRFVVPEKESIIEL